MKIRFDASVTILGFASAGANITVESIECSESGLDKRIPVGATDCVFVTNGSMDGRQNVRVHDDGSTGRSHEAKRRLELWETLAQGRPQFGNPSAFDAHIEESAWESFTVTVREPTFFERMQKFSGSEPGKGGLITFKDSSWLITISIYHQPYFPNQPDVVFVWWGYGLFPRQARRLRL